MINSSDALWPTADEVTQRISSTPRPQGLREWVDEDDEPTKPRIFPRVSELEAVLHRLSGSTHYHWSFSFPRFARDDGTAYVRHIGRAAWIDRHTGRIRTACTRDDAGFALSLPTLDAAYERLIWQLEEELINAEYEARCIEREREAARRRSWWARARTWLGLEAVAA